MKFGGLLSFSIILSSSLAFAGPPPATPPPSATEAPYNWQLGPKPLSLGHEVQLQLPEGYVFLGMPDADRFLKKNGSFDNEGVLGVVMSRDEKQSWGIILDYQEAGYVKDDEKLDPGAILKSIREGTEEGNKERVKNGFPALSVGDWTESPHYDHATHRLVWALPATSTTGTTINYNTRVLGRRGYVSLNLLSGAERIAVEKSNAATLLAATTFKNGARYEDFDKKTDKVAEYGLMGLILGGAGIAAVKVAKVGLLAGLFKFLIAGWKIVVAFFIAMGAGIKKFFTGKSAGVPEQKETKLPPTGTDGPNS
jgi:uncharacterized membrane-anchored protein